MLEYQTLFDERGAQYHHANVSYPFARDAEARALLERLSLSPGTRWLDVFAGGGFLSARAREHGLPPARVSCDGSLPFLHASSEIADACVAAAEALPFADGSFDAVGCLAALHHAEDPGAVVAELVRVAAPGGRVAIGDAAPNSPTARFLNGFVDRHTARGHHGRFHALGALEGFLAAAGAREVETARVPVEWTVPSPADALRFCRDLFGLSRETPDGEIEAALADLGVRAEHGRVAIPWTMHYASGARA